MTVYINLCRSEKEKSESNKSIYPQIINAAEAFIDFIVRPTYKKFVFNTHRQETIESGPLRARADPIIKKLGQGLVARVKASTTLFW